MTRDWDLRGDELASESIARGRADRVVRPAVRRGRGRSRVHAVGPHDPARDVREWAAARSLDGTGKEAVVVGCGLGADAEYAASLGFATTAFDVSTTAVELALARNPGTTVDYRVADLLALPHDLPGRFDLVVEIFTLQALPDPPRAAAAAAVRSLVAEGGTMLPSRSATTGATRSTRDRRSP